VKNVDGNYNGEYLKKLGEMGLWGTGPFIRGRHSSFVEERMELIMML